MTDADLAAVDRLADRIHVKYPEDSAVFMERFKLYPAGCFMLEGEGGTALGYAITHPWHFKKPPALNVHLEKIPAEPTTYYIHDIALAPEARGSGAGFSIVERVIAHAQATGVPNMSLIAVNGSERFWARHGFEILTGDPVLDAKVKSYDDDARFMVKGL